MSLPAEVAARVAKLVPMLSSDQDGEALAAVRAIGRTLTAARLDFHALASAIQGGGSIVRLDFADVFRSRHPAPEPTPPRPKTWGMPIWGTSKIEPWTVVADHCLQIDWAIPKAGGGKFLTKKERARLKVLSDWRRPKTQDDADWLEATWNRCYAVREAWRAARQRTAA